MNDWRNTSVTQVSNLWSMQAMALTFMESLTWRWSGLGLLQAYLYQDPPREALGFGRQAGQRGHELRIHIWSEKLVASGIDRNGNVHNHRFAMRSTVLYGSLQHDEYLHSGHPEGDYVLWDFPNVAAATPEERCQMRPLVGRYHASVSEGIVESGQQYTFSRGAYHRSYPLVEPTITVVEKYDQNDESARVLAPHGTLPVSAFVGKPHMPTVMSVILDAKERLRAALREGP